ncbi:long-chain acyl-CoA synthetase [Virgibacillus subterraneus]|uniref:Long-chain acyl-CoA synthetase n=2 Tax=Virgibacillus TaxID=84406 RepID=A0A1H1AZF1_9BACI|nr:MULTISPECIES: long-chain-fatty-acid--CoA ligase [Virgibacillus]SDQ45095.1 long-chain acyl-CoA synthetase [Virgibacillus salinus]SEQ12999.1 long-chain acyl-CoA synthetase [Virgibacillus subterraneus]
MENKRWHDHYPEEIPTTIEYDQKPLHSFLAATAELYPEKKALHFMGKEITFAEVFSQAKKMAKYMQSLGLEKGDRVAVMLPNCPQAVISYYGALMAGAVVVQTNPLYKERELEYQLNDSGATFIVCLDILLPRVTNVRGNTSLKHTIVTGIKDYLPFPKNLIYPFIQKKQYNMVVKVEQSEDTHVWQSIIENGDEDYNPIEVNPIEDLALLQYTGGTTGHPKGVMLSHYNLVANVQMSQAWLYKAKPGKETVLGVLPFFHVYGMTTVMNMAIMFGSKMVLLPKFDAEEVLKTIHKQKPTMFPGAPTIYVGLLNHPNLKKYDLSSIEACISGSAPLPTEVQEQFEKVTGGRLVEGYGLTESSPVTHANFVWDNRVNGSIGVPWPDTDAKIFKVETMEEADVGEVGEVAVKGPQIMKGYWNNQEETDNVLKDGWLFTGDLGYMNEEGYFYIVDRKKDMIIAGGYNIYPREVEEILYEHEAVQEAVVAGIPDPYRGETVKAYVVQKSGYEIEEEELNAHCRKHLAAFKVPRIYEFRDELPKTAVGKILRRKLVDEEKEKLQEKSNTI